MFENVSMQNSKNTNKSRDSKYYNTKISSDILKILNSANICAKSLKTWDFGLLWWDKNVYHVEKSMLYTFTVQP